MSTIDQAFINAYADQQPTTLPPRGKFAVREPGPALRVFTQGMDSESSELRVDKPQQRAAGAQAPYLAGKVSSPHAEIAARQQADVADAAELALPSLIGERKPLSALAAPKPAPAAAFKPVFEVDEFRWPAIVDELVTTSRQHFIPVVELLMSVAAAGRTLVGISGAKAQVGASTVSMCLARLIADTGCAVAMVDANLARGDLARTLGLEFNQGWEDVLAGNLPLAECAVASLADKMTLIPLGGPADDGIERLTSIQASVIAGMLRYHYDLVLFDLGTASDPTQYDATRGIVENCRLDAGIIVTTVGARDASTSHGIEQLDKIFGQMCLGTVGNRAG